MVGVGIAVALVAALGNAVAIVMLAVEARRSPDSEAMHASLLLRLAHRPRWLLAIAVMIAAGVLQITALALAPIAIVQPTLATSQLMLLGIARLRRPEVVGRREVAGSLLVLAGIGCVVAAAPLEHTSYGVTTGIAAPMATVGCLALVTFAFGRLHPRVRGLLAIGAGLAYAWSDFVAKLLSSAAATGTWWLVAVWVGAIVAIGGLAFLEENTALQHRLAITVAPVIVAFKVPIPVLMALWSGVEPWRGDLLQEVVLPLGLVLAAAGAYTLGRSHAVAGVSAGDGPTRVGNRADRTARLPARRPGRQRSALALERGGGESHAAYECE